MRTIKIQCRLEYTVRQPTTFLFNVGVKKSPGQRVINESLGSDPAMEVEAAQFGFEGNRLHRLRAEPCEFRLEYTATVEIDPVVESPEALEEVDLVHLPSEVLPYLNPSRFCESDLLGRFAYEEFGGVPAGYGRVQAIADWVSLQLDYTPGSTTATTTAADVLLSRTGVCRDYAHLAIALCRGIGVPARYVSVYAVDLDPPDFHGVFEAYLGGDWYLFDASRLAPTQGFVRIGMGRDAADVAFATIVGDAVLEKKVVSVEQLEGPALDAQGSNDAVSLA